MNTRVRISNKKNALRISNPPSGKKDRGRGTQAADAATLGTRDQASPPPPLPVGVETPSAVTTGMGLSGGQFLEGHTNANPLGGHSASEGQKRLLTGKKWAERPKTGEKGADNVWLPEKNGGLAGATPPLCLSEKKLNSK